MKIPKRTRIFEQPEDEEEEEEAHTAIQIINVIVYLSRALFTVLCHLCVAGQFEYFHYRLQHKNNIAYQRIQYCNRRRRKIETRRWKTKQKYWIFMWQLTNRLLKQMWTFFSSSIVVFCCCLVTNIYIKLKYSQFGAQSNRWSARINYFRKSIVMNWFSVFLSFSSVEFLKIKLNHFRLKIECTWLCWTQIFKRLLNVLVTTMYISGDNRLYRIVYGWYR